VNEPLFTEEELKRLLGHETEPTSPSQSPSETALPKPAFDVVTKNQLTPIAPIEKVENQNYSRPNAAPMPAPQTLPPSFSPSTSSGNIVEVTLEKPTTSVDSIKSQIAPPPLMQSTPIEPPASQPIATQIVPKPLPEPLQGNESYYYDNYVKDRKKKPVFATIVRTITSFILIFIISYSLINAQALTVKMKYFWQVDYQNQSWQENRQDTLLKVAKENNHLYIPKIQVDAPISWGVNDNDMIKKLETGVAQYVDTAFPGQVGNVFINGHSSYYPWAAGDYKTVFALLERMETGDLVYIHYNNTIYTYKISGKKVVYPNNLTVLNPTPTKTLSIMTCVPVGTSLQRLIVTADQIDELKIK